MAAKNKMDLSIGIALGSSIQVCMLRCACCAVHAWPLQGRACEAGVSRPAAHIPNPLTQPCTLPCLGGAGQPAAHFPTALPSTHQPYPPSTSIQVALGILPLTVIASWAMGKEFILDFDQFSVSLMYAGLPETMPIRHDVPACKLWGRRLAHRCSSHAAAAASSAVGLLTLTSSPPLSYRIPCFVGPIGPPSPTLPDP